MLYTQPKLEDDSPTNPLLEYRPGFWESLATGFTEGFESGPLKSSLRVMERDHFQQFPDMTAEEVREYAREWGAQATPGLALERQQALIDAAGLTGKIEPDPVWDQETLEGILLARQDAEGRRLLLANSSGLASAGSVIGEMAGFSADPLNLLSMFIPVVGEERALALLGKAGSITARTLTRARIGAAEGIAGVAAVEGITAGAANLEQRDYGPLQSLMNLACGGVFGAGLRAAGGLVKEWRVRDDWLNPWELAEGSGQSREMVARHAREMAEARMAADPELSEKVARREALAHALSYDVFIRNRAYRERRPLDELYNEWTLDYKSGDVIHRATGRTEPLPQAFEQGPSRPAPHEAGSESAAHEAAPETPEATQAPRVTEPAAPHGEAPQHVEPGEAGQVHFEQGSHDAAPHETAPEREAQQAPRQAPGETQPQEQASWQAEQAPHAEAGQESGITFEQGPAERSASDPAFDPAADPAADPVAHERPPQAPEHSERTSQGPEHAEAASAHEQASGQGSDPALDPAADPAPEPAPEPAREASPEALSELEASPPWVVDPSVNVRAPLTERVFSVGPEGDVALQNPGALLEAGADLSRIVDANAGGETATLTEFLGRQRAIISFFEGADSGSAGNALIHVMRRQLAEAAMGENASPAARELWASIEEACDVSAGHWDLSAENRFAQACKDFFWKGEIANPNLAPAVYQIRSMLGDVYNDAVGRGWEGTSEARAAVARIYSDSPESYVHNFRRAFLEMLESEHEAPSHPLDLSGEVPEPEALARERAALDAEIAAHAEELKKLENVDPELAAELKAEEKLDYEALAWELKEAGIYEDFAACLLSM